MREINRIIVHCSATPPDMDIGADEIRGWHKERGWDDIGYHAVIRRDGTIEPGRPVEISGAHAQGHNADSIGVCLVGGVKRETVAGHSTLVPEANFTAEQYARLLEYVDDLQFERWKEELDPLDVVGHRDLPGVAKDCPCFDVRSFFEGNLSWYT